MKVLVHDGVRVAGTCTITADSSIVPATASTSSLGNGTSVELTPASGRNILEIRAGIIADKAALKALQQYVDQVCLAKHMGAPN